MADTAVVILNYNGRHHLQQFLPSVVDHSANTTIYVVDNCSSDDSIAFIQSHYPQLTLIAFEQNYGYAGGYNHALEQINEPYCVLLNSDVEVTPNWIDPIVEFMQKNSEVAACQPKILDYRHRDRFEYAGAAGGFIDRLGYPFCRGRIFDSIETDHGQYDNAIPVFWASGACLFVRTAAFKTAGGLDEDFFAHMEEIDLCWRFHKMGHAVFCIPESKVYHLGGGTLDKSSARKTFLNFRNNLIMLFKNEPLTTTIWKIPVRVVLDWLAAIKFLKAQGFAHFLAIFRAHAGFVVSIPATIKKRRAFKSHKHLLLKVPNLVLPIQYFLMRRKKFSDYDLD